MTDNDEQISPEKRKLEQEIEKLTEEFTREYDEIRNNWALGVGRIGVRGLDSRWIAGLYVIFGLITFITGVVFTFVGNMRELGVALVVGSTFAFGSIVGQWWAVAIQREVAINDRIFREDAIEKMTKMFQKGDEISARLQSIERSEEPG
jgi:hypothetical protein